MRAQRRFEILGLAALTLLVLSDGRSNAAVIVGPTSWTTVGGSDTNWGIQFTALDSSVLTSFDYTHRTANFGNPFSGTITLKDATTNTTVYSTTYSPLAPTGNPALSVLHLTGLNVSLKAGDVYDLFATSSIVFSANDEVSQFLVLNSPPLTYPTSDADISVTSGYFSGATTGFPANSAWAAFTNLTTSPPPVAPATPEPSSLALLGLGGFGLVAYRRWRKRASA